MSNFEVYQLIFTIAALLIQVGALWLCYKQVIFARKYSKLWASAFVVFFVTMVVTFIRRIIVIGDILDVWGVSVFLQWSDHTIIPFINSIGWVTFLYVLKRWWTTYFSTYDHPHANLQKREAAVQKREELVAKKEIELLITEPNGVHVEEPEKVIVELGDKKVHLEKPKRVIVINPKSVTEE